MTLRKSTSIGGGDRENRQRVSHELQQLKQMGKSLRTTALQSFMKRATAARRDVKRPERPVKPTPVAA
jgi:hypothetical protein